MSFFGLLGGGDKLKPTGSERRLGREANTEARRADYRGERAKGSRNMFLNALQGGQAELERTLRAAVTAALPQFDHRIQGARESAISRGVSNGELGTSYEGDLASAFQRNIATAGAGEALDLYRTKLGGVEDVYHTDVGQEETSRNRYLDIVAGNADREQARQNANARKRSGLFGGLGALAGFALGGPAGAEIGHAAGSGLG